jgi:hypothetical protein
MAVWFAAAFSRWLMRVLAAVCGLFAGRLLLSGRGAVRFI